MEFVHLKMSLKPYKRLPRKLPIRIWLPNMNVHIFPANKTVRKKTQQWLIFMTDVRLSWMTLRKIRFMWKTDTCDIECFNIESLPHLVTYMTREIKYQNVAILGLVETIYNGGNEVRQSECYRKFREMWNGRIKDNMGYEHIVNVLAIKKHISIKWNVEEKQLRLKMSVLSNKKYLLSLSFFLFHFI